MSLPSLRSTTVLLCLTLGQVVPAGAQASGNWDAVRALASGTGVVVTTRQDRRVSGKVLTVSDETLRLLVSLGRERALPRDAVREVRRRHRIGVGQSFLLGMAVGGVTGWFIGRAHADAYCATCGERAFVTFAGTFSGAFFGAIGGFIFGEAVHARPGRLIYAAPAP